MTIKLVRTDTEDPCKIQLPLGDHVIGRGKLLECDDKRISRHHGELQVSDDSLSIKALHQNPCFYIKKGVSDTEILRQNNTITLHNGDRFGLLPDAFWYEVLFCSGLEAPKNFESEKNTEEYCVENNECNDNITTSGEANCDKTKTSDFNLDDGIGNEIAELHSPSLIATVSVRTSVPSEIDSGKEDELIEPNVQNDSSVQNKPNEPDIQNEPNVQKEQLEQAMPSLNEEQNNEINSTKRSHSPDNSDVKKIKTEPVEIKTEHPDDVKPGPSLNQGYAAQPTNNGGANGGASNNNPLRERCMYGANCYRKNPQHRAQFSHPQDADWGAGARGVCPYGAACVKADPRHWRDHEHPPGKLPPPRPGMQVVQRHGNVYFINAHSVNFYDDHFQVEDSDGDSVDFDYEF